MPAAWQAPAKSRWRSEAATSLHCLRGPRASCPDPSATLHPTPRAHHAPRPAAALGSWRRESRCQRAGPPRQRSIADAENATRARRTAARMPRERAGQRRARRASAVTRQRVCRAFALGAEKAAASALGLCSAARSPAPRKPQRACRTAAFWAPATVRRRRQTASVISKVFPVIR